LLRSLQKVMGSTHYLAYMDSFRYALSGEFAFVRNLARGLRISPTWGLEVSTLSEVYENTSLRRICQTEVADWYTHKHQGLSDLSAMTGDIAQTLIRILSQPGKVFSAAVFESLVSTYYNEAVKIIGKYNGVSKFNGFAYDRGEELKGVNAFTGMLENAFHDYLNDPFGVPLLSSWVTVRGVLPDFAGKLQEAVELDNSS